MDLLIALFYFIFGEKAWLLEGAFIFSHRRPFAQNMFPVRMYINTTTQQPSQYKPHYIGCTPSVPQRVSTLISAQSTIWSLIKIKMKSSNIHNTK
jgi:hypothetical protein